MNDDIEKMRINKSKGTIALLDADMVQVTSRLFATIKHRKEIIDFWKRTYHLDGKVYCIIISPK